MALSTEEVVAITALIVASFAFLVAIGQILGQYLNTADGFRRCQKQVIGGWASKTRRQFRWEQFRFEVLYTTPRIAIVPESKIYFVKSSEDEAPRRVITSDNSGSALTEISNSAASREQTHSPRDANSIGKLDGPSLTQAAYLASWISMIDRLHNVQGLYQNIFKLNLGVGKGNYKGISLPSQASFTDGTIVQTFPCLVPCEQSWDFMPPELLRPVASITLGDLIVLAHRMGMTWQELRLGTGVLHAEGHGQSMFASMARGFGIMVQYTRDDAFEIKNMMRECEKLLVPSMAADKLSFGIIPGYLGMMDDLYLQSDDNSFAEINNTLVALDVAPGEQNEIRKLWIDRNSFTGFSDVIALVPPFLPIPGSSITTVRRPLRHMRGPLLWREGRAAFRTRLHHELIRLRTSGKHKALAQLEMLLSRYMHGFHHWRSEWGIDGEGKRERNTRKRGLLDYLQQQHDYTTHWFFEFTMQNNSEVSDEGRITYKHLVAAHLSHATSCHLRALKNIQENKKRELDPEVKVPGGMAIDLFETFHVYVDNLPQFVKRVKATCSYKDDEMIELAWWTMMFRGLCWYLSVSFVGPLDRSSDGRGGMIIPSALWDSQVPVHIV